MRTIFGKRLFFLYPQKIFLEKVWRLKKKVLSCSVPNRKRKGKKQTVKYELKNIQ